MVDALGRLFQLMALFNPEYGEFSPDFPRGLGGVVPLRSASLPGCVPLDGSEPDAKVETLDSFEFPELPAHAHAILQD